MATTKKRKAPKAPKTVTGKVGQKVVRFAGRVQRLGKRVASAKNAGQRGASVSRSWSDTGKTEKRIRKIITRKHGPY